MLNVGLLIQGKWNRMSLIDQQTLIEHKASLLLLVMLFSLWLQQNTVTEPRLVVAREFYFEIVYFLFHFENKSLAMLIAPNKLECSAMHLEKLIIS